MAMASTNEQKFNTIVKQVKKYGTCFPIQMARAIYFRYGIQDITEWVQDDKMLDTLAEVDPDVASLWKIMQERFRIDGRSYGGSYKGMNMGDLQVKKYCLTLQVRELLLWAVQDGDIDSLEDETAEADTGS